MGFFSSPQPNRTIIDTLYICQYYKPMQPNPSNQFNNPPTNTSGSSEGGKVFASVEARLVDQTANRIAKRVELGKVDFSDFTSETEIETFLLQNGLIKDGIPSKDVMATLRALGVITIPEIVSESKNKKDKKSEPEFIPISIEKKELKIVEDEEGQRHFSEYQEEEKLKEEKDGIFDDEAELDALYADVQKLEKVKGMESDDYYYEFAKAGLIKGGEAEVRKDLAKLAEIESAFGDESQEKSKSKKIASMTEIGLEYGVTDLNWYGDKVKVLRSSKFDDVRRGVDDVLEILKENPEGIDVSYGGVNEKLKESAEGSSFLGLGIDVTYRGLYSEQYKNKVFNLLKSIRDGYKTKVKYFKDHAGNMTKEFAVPKAILYFDFGEVKKMAYMLKNIDDESVKQNFKNSPMKFDVMNQIIVQCDIMARFARKHGNSIADAYDDVRASIEALAGDNAEIKTMLAVRHEDKTSKHLNELIAQFEAENPADQRAAA